MTQREQTRAREPDLAGVTERDGVRLAYEVYGEGDTDGAADADLVDRPLAVLEGAGRPTWPGTTAWSPSTGGAPAGPAGRSGAAAYTNEEFAADTIAVMDATGTDAGRAGRRCPAGRPGRCTSRPSTRTGCIGHRSRSGRRAGSTSADPDRDAVRCGRRRRRHHDGLGEVQQALLARRRLRRLPASSSSRKMFPEPHSTKQIEDCVGWGARDQRRRPWSTPPPAGSAATARSARRSSRLCAQVRCPVLVIHGTDDRIRPHDDRRAARRAHRRVAGAARGRRARAARRATRCWSTS